MEKHAPMLMSVVQRDKLVVKVSHVLIQKAPLLVMMLTNVQLEGTTVKQEPNVWIKEVDLVVKTLTSVKIQVHVIVTQTVATLMAPTHAHVELVIKVLFIKAYDIDMKLISL